MRIKILLAAFLSFCCIASANVPLMPIKDLRSGMRGIGKTVVSGDTIENFDVEVLGVMGNETSGYNVFVHLSGPLIERTGGVAQGMSGSPVYIDGQLVGAVAFGKAFNDPHYCFLTPIGSMLELLDKPAAVELPLGTSLQAGGFSERGLNYLKEKLGPEGLDVTLGGVGSGESTSEIEPGSSISVALMHGDLSLAALGTVTWIDDEGDLLAMGHSFLQRGESAFFMNRAWIVGCVPNLQTSYKVGVVGENIGTFTQDRASGVGGKIGRGPPSIPVFIRTSDFKRGVNNSCRVKIVDDEKLLSTVLDAVVGNMVTKTMDTSGFGSGKLRFIINGVDENRESITIDRENMYYSADNVISIMNQEMTEAVNILTKNKFEKVDIYDITVDAEVTEDVEVAEIQSVRTQKYAMAGETVSIEVTMKPYRGETFKESVNFTIPKDFPGKKIALSVRGGSSITGVKNLLEQVKGEAQPQSNEIGRSLRYFINSLNSADKNNDLIVDLAAPPKAQLGAAMQGNPYKKKTPYDYIIDGEAEVVLNIVK